MVVKFTMHSGYDAARQICDNCHISRKKCDRNLPCYRCKQRSLECTLLRKLKTKRFMNNNPDFLKQTFVSSKLNKTGISTKDSELIGVKSSKVCDGTLSLANHRFLSNGYSELRIPSYKIQALVLALIPNTGLILPQFDWQDGLSLFKTKPLLYTDKLLVKSGLIKQPIINTFDMFIENPEEILLNFYTDLYLEGVDAFFKHHNPFFPLFTKHNYFKVDRPSYLKCAVWLIGVSFLSKDFKVVDLIKQINKYLDKEIPKLIFNPTLHIVQTLCICTYGVRRQLYTINSFHWFSLVQLAHMLGLHRRVKVNKANLINCLERNMTMSYILSFNTFVDLHVMNGSDYYQLNFEESINFINNDNDLNLNLSDDQRTVKYTTLSLLVVSHFLYKLSFFLIELERINRSLNPNIQQEPTTSVNSIQIKLANMRIKSKELLVDSAVELYKLKEQSLRDKSFEIATEIDNLISATILNYCSVQLWTLNCKIYEHPQTTYTSQELKLGKDVCLQTFIHTNKIKSPLSFRPRAKHIFSALNYLVETYHIYNKHDIDKVLKLGMKRLDNLKHIPIYSNSHSFSSDLITKLMAKHNVNVAINANL